MINKYVKIIDPDHQYFGETFLVFFAVTDSITVRGQGIHLTLKPSQVEEGKREDYISVKPGTALENLVIEKKEVPEPVKKEEDIPTCPPPTKPLVIINENEKKVLLDVLAKVQVRVAEAHKLSLPAQVVVGIVKIYFEEMQSIEPELKELAIDIADQERIIK